MNPLIHYRGFGLLGICGLVLLLASASSGMATPVSAGEETPVFQGGAWVDNQMYYANLSYASQIGTLWR